MASPQPKKPIFHHFRSRSSARLALLLVVMNDRGKFHPHRVRHRGGRAELVWWCPQGRGPRWSQNIVANLRTQIPKLTYAYSCVYTPVCIHAGIDVYAVSCTTASQFG
jgi:hypothetical protein